MDRPPPPVTQKIAMLSRGPSPAARLLFFSLLSLAAMVADHRFGYLADVRQAVSTIAYPLERAVLAPVSAYRSLAEHVAANHALLEENEQLRTRLAEQSANAQRAALLEQEIAYLKALIAAPERFNARGVVAEIIHTGRNPFIRKVVIDKGANDAVRAGLPVIDDLGVVGQITAVTPFSAEVTLATDKGQAIPVVVVRNGLRAVAFGDGDLLQIPFLPTNADIRPGDQLVTSGIDGTYPPGLAVATVSEVDQATALSFSKIAAKPAGGVDRRRYLSVLTTHPGADYPLQQWLDEKEKERGAGPARRARGRQR